MPSNNASEPADDLSRKVYCILGVPIDDASIQEAADAVAAAAIRKTPFLVATPNLNFLVMSQWDAEFRESLLRSDLSLPDGVGVVWAARLLGLPIRGRVAGSDLFDALRENRYRDIGRKLSVFLFGGPDGVAEEACRRINARSNGLRCAGHRNPGVGHVEAMSDETLLTEMNSSQADFLVVALGAQKGQSWLVRNHHKLTIPVRGHFGASLGFQAGTLRRAPVLLRKSGLEWFWRILQEPQLAPRYWNDGWKFIRLSISRLLPYAAALRRGRRRWRAAPGRVRIEPNAGTNTVCVILSGFLGEHDLEQVRTVFREALLAQRDVRLDFGQAKGFDPWFLGSVLMLRKALASQRLCLSIENVPREIAEMLRWNSVEFLLSPSFARTARARM
jgi:N-acetylglucosaminyldiphosphoundecaprenol N-acetyl-beta-D-mannosaminyltransferase